jgi:hypothetical protein
MSLTITYSAPDVRGGEPWRVTLPIHGDSVPDVLSYAQRRLAEALELFRDPGWHEDGVYPVNEDAMSYIIEGNLY